MQNLPEVFKNIIERLPLLDSHRESLKKNRGFTDEVIDLLKFKSVSDSIVAKDSYLSSLPDKFRVAFRNENILIPYFQREPDGTDKIIHVRPHKWGIEGLPIYPYIPYHLLGEDQSTLVIAESEFKAIASCMYGVPAIGIPGISSFCDKRFNMLPDLMNGLKTKHCVICFDNEIKDDEKFGNFKKDFRKRYDTQFYAFVMAMKLHQEAKIKTSIAVLDPKWMVNGKVDIDGILAAGVTAEEYKGCINSAMTCHEYKRSWNVPVLHKSFLERRIDRFFYSGPISENFGIYYKKTKSGGDKPLSNFVIRLINTMYNEDGHAERACRFNSKYGPSKAILLTSEAMTSKKAFQKLCYDAGDFEFYGKDEDIMDICKFLFIHQDGRMVYKVPYFGYCEENETWFFGNGAYRDGKFYELNDDRIIWIDDIGYKMMDNVDALDIPVLSSDRDKDVTIQDIYYNISNILNINEAKLIVGWAIGNFFMPEILDEFKVYPFMFLFGKMAAGKTTIANWMSSFFGFTQSGINFHSTSVGVSRLTSQMSMIPVWLEEYRNKDKDIGRKNNFLRSIYDRSTIVKGTKKEGEIKSFRARSTLIISGEEHPQDAALNSRCIMFPIYRSPDNSKSDKYFEWLKSHQGSFNQIGDYLLLNKKELWPQIRDRIHSYILAFKSGDVSVTDRQKTQMSIIGGLCDVFIGKSEEFSSYIGEKAEGQDLKVFNEQALYIFLEDLQNMHAAGRLKNDFIRREGNKVFFWMSLAYSEWEIYYKGLRNEIPASRAALYEHIKKELFYIETGTKRMGNKTPYVFILDYNHPQFPKTLGSIVDSIDAEKQNQMMDWGRNANEPGND